MSLTTFVPPVPPSPGTNRKPIVKLLEASFGDGYSQIMRDGLNHMKLTVRLKWDVLLETQALALDAFFRARGGDEPFYYTLIHDVQRKWTCKDFGWTNDTPNTYEAVLTETFDLRT